MFINSYQQFVDLIDVDERAYFDRWCYDHGFTEQQMKAMSMFEFNVKVLKPMDCEPEYQRMKVYYELASGVKSRKEQSVKTLKERKDRYWSKVFGVMSQYHTPEGIERCSNCGLHFEDYQNYYDFGNDMLLCYKCMDAFRNLYPILIHHIPGCVERDDIPCYLWTDLATFLKDKPARSGYHYEYSDDHIMEVSDDGQEWWVIWNIKHPKIMKEVLEGLPEWECPK